EPYMPWELMIPGRVEGGVRKWRSLPLGAEFGVGRWLRGDHLHPSQSLKLADSCIFAPQYKPGSNPNPFTHAADEPALVNKGSPGNPIAPASFGGFKAAMKAGGATVIHFVCHGVDNPSKFQQIFCDDDTTLSSVQLDGLDELVTACAA